MRKFLLLLSFFSILSAPAFAGNPKVGLVVAGLVNPQLSDQQVQSVLQQARQSGAQFVREVFYWNDLQPTGPSFNDAYLRAADRFVREAINAGLTPYITLQGTPPWVRHCTQDGSASCDPAYSDWRYPPSPDKLTYWADFVSAVVNRYPQVTYWGVWNEPNDINHLKLSPKYSDWFGQYYDLFSYAANVIQNAPGRVIGGPELGSGVSSRGLSPEDELRSFISAFGYRLRPQDILTVHFYGVFPYSAWDLERRMVSYNNIAAEAWLSNHIWLTETGSGVWETDNIDQALVLARTYQKISNTAATRWTKVFKYHLWSTHEDRHLVKNALGSPIYRPAYSCLQAIANGAPLPSACACIPNGRRDDTLGEAYCCSGRAQPGSTTCTNQGDYNTTWESCSHICAP